MLFRLFSGQGRPGGAGAARDGVQPLVRHHGRRGGAVHGRHGQADPGAQPLGRHRVAGRLERRVGQPAISQS